MTELFTVDLPASPKDELPARYFRKHLERDLSELGQRVPDYGIEPELLELLRYRYGERLVSSLDLNTRGKYLDDLIIDAAEKQNQLKRKDGLCVLPVPWNPQAAQAWFDKRLRKRWPRNYTAFFAADLHTSWSACLALDYAPVREKRFADDPFPAPPLLIIGPTGTGKELLAEAVHRTSGRTGEFGKLNCGGLPAALLESELFGHVRGAFTGAVKDKTGIVPAFKEGSLFLDEVGDMPPEIQVRLLRFLNDGEYRAVGATKHEQATPRIIAATNVPLAQYVTDGQFRGDLYHRINGRQIHLKPLCERRESIPSLVEAFLARYDQQAEHSRKTLSPAARKAFQAYDWPGNMREMKYVIEQCLEESSQATIVIADLPPVLQEAYWSDKNTALAERDALSLIDHKLTEESKSRMRARIYYTVDARWQMWSQSVISREKEKICLLLDYIAQTFDLKEWIDPFVGVLRANDKAAQARSFRDQWMNVLKRTLCAHGLDPSGALAEWLKMLTKVEKDAQAAEKRFADAAKSAKAVNGLSAAVAAFLTLVQAKPEVLEPTDAFVRTISSPPFTSTIHKFIGEIRSLSPIELKQAIKSFFWSAIQDAQIIDVDEEETLEWSDIRDEPKLLRELLEQYDWKIKRVAESVEKTTKTIKRAIEKHNLKERTET